jgi:tetratricopeptide (TPR) repeat protein
MALYDAFVSYSHAKDKPIAAALQSVVQKLGKPWYRRRALRVFRDDTSLSATPHLWPTIEQALGQSRFFILLASPEAAASKWVNKEVSYWLDHNSVDTLLIGVTDGDLVWDEKVADFAAAEKMPLPPVLSARFPNEPKWIDLRAYRDSADKGDAKFTDLGADFAAAIRGMPKEDLLSQEVRQQRRALTLAWSAAGSLLILAGLAAWQWQEAIAQKNEALTQKNEALTQKYRAQQMLAQATETTNGLIFDLANRFRDAGLPANIVTEILDRARALQEQLADAGQATPELRKSEGLALIEAVSALLRVGDIAGAQSAAERALRLFQELAASGSGDANEWSRYIGLAHGYIGEVLAAQNDLDGAYKSYQAAFEIFERLATANDEMRAAFTAKSSRDGGPEYDHDRWLRSRRDLATAHGRLGDVLIRQSKLREALTNYQAALAIRQDLLRFKPDDPGEQRGLATSYNKLGVVNGELALAHHKLGEDTQKDANLEEALKNYRECLTIMQRLAAADPNNTSLKRDLAVAYDRVAEIVGAQGKYEESLKLYRDNLAILDRLAASDRSNSSWQYDLAMSYAHIGDLFKAQKKFDEALANLSKEQAMLATLIAANSGNVEWQSSFSNVCVNIGDILMNQGKLDLAFKGLQDCVAAQGLVSASDSNWIRQSATKMSGRIGTLAYRLILSRDFARALEAADLSIVLAPDKLWLYTNRAHALMLLGRSDEAKSLYLRYSGGPPAQGQKSWEALVLDDFAKLRRQGIRNPLMEEVEAKFTAGG